MADEALYYLYQDGEFYIKAVGHITAALCPDLKLQMQTLLESHKVLSGVLVDLGECEYMDSTFMGLILGFNKILKEQKGKILDILNPSEESILLLKGLGIFRLLNIINEKRSLPSPMVKALRERLPSAEFLLNTHQDLMDVSEENKNKFSLLEKVLKSQIQKES